MENLIAVGPYVVGSAIGRAVWLFALSRVLLAVVPRLSSTTFSLAVAQAITALGYTVLLLILTGAEAVTPVEITATTLGALLLWSWDVWRLRRRSTAPSKESAKK